MAFVETWDETKPAGTRDRSLGDDDIREFKRALRERLAVDHEFYEDEAGQNVGYHSRVTLAVRGSDESAVANAGVLYTKDVSAKAELHWVDEDGNVVQITSAGYINKDVIENSAFVPEGAIVMWAGTIAGIPTGWKICDGNNSTPNLLDKFVCCVATAATEPGTTGGASTHTHDAGTYAGPAHTHTVTPATAFVSAGGFGYGDDTTVTSSSSGTGAVTGTSASSSSLPPYYALAFIRKA